MITLGFNEGVVSSSAATPSFYSVFAGVKKHKKMVFTKAWNIEGVTYNSALDRVTIALAKPLKGAFEVKVQGTIAASDGASGSVGFTKVIT